MLHINDLVFRLGPRILFDGATAAIPTGARTGFVGRNGTGKTTLFKMISGELHPESGTLSIPSRMKLGQVEQEAPGGPTTLIEFVLEADRERASLLAEAETATEPGRIAEIQTRLVDIEAHAAPSRAATILTGLGFDEAAQNRALSEFSGGWRMRVALAAVLFTRPDLLLLDEPTNYLDLEGTLWLIDYLATYPATVLIISHDRDLLDAVCDHILHLDQAKLTLWRGNYASFERQRREQQAIQLKHKKKQEEQRKHLQSFVDRFRASATKARQAQSRIKMLARLEPITAMVDSDVLPFHLPSPARPLSPPIIALDGASVGYDERIVLSRLSLNISNDDRIGLLGSNGNGKSTFAKLVAGRMEVAGGRAAALLQADRRLFRAASGRRTGRRAKRLCLCGVAHARRHRSPHPGQMRAARLSGHQGGHADHPALGRRKGAADDGAGGLRGAAPADPRRAHQPSRHRQPHRIDRRHQRLRGRGHPHLA